MGEQVQDTMMTTSPALAHSPYPSPRRKALITGSVMLSTMIAAMDSTIANVALPQMQSSLSASSEQILWVLTSYMIASAIMTPVASWLARRFGRKPVMALSVAGFTLASLACGMATSLPMMILARLIQGISSASLLPLGQATLLDINPPETQGKAMAMAGLGSMVGPLAGPTLGGWLTDVTSWRWVFLINLPIGVLAFIGLSTSMDDTRDKNVGRFDTFGFATISIFLGAFQLMMDRGQQLDWFDSREITLEATIAGLFAYFAVVHMFTARETFIRAEIFKDRNFSIGSLISAVIGIITFATVPIIMVMMQTLLGYTAFFTGLISMPRGVGTTIAIVVAGNLVNRMDTRILLFAGLSVSAFSLYLFTRISLDTDQMPLIVAGLLQGFGGGLMIVPLTTLVFSTLSPEYRNEGAAIFALTRNIGASLGISGLQAMAIHNSANVATRLSAAIRPDNPMLQMARPDFSFAAAQSLAGVSAEISRQAAMVATLDTIWFACLLALALLPVILFMRNRPRAPDANQGAASAALEAHL
jgi:DHA2 family multidrug resistance protein